jgi:ribosomal protein L4
MVAIMNNMNVAKWLFAMLPNDRDLFLATRNLATIKPIGVNYLNPMDLMKYNDVVFTKDSLEYIAQVYS